MRMHKFIESYERKPVYINADRIILVAEYVYLNKYGDQGTGAAIRWGEHEDYVTVVEQSVQQVIDAITEPT